MSRLSNKLFIAFNILALISGFIAIGSYIYFQIHGVTDCKNVVQKPLIIMGIALAAISILGLIGICFKLTWLLWTYSLLAFLTLFGLTTFSIVVYTIGNANTSKSSLASLGFKKHNLGGNYEEWLINMVESRNNWKSIRSCLVKNHVCNRVRDNNLIEKGSDFHVLHNLSPIENGCCKPPTECGYKYKNGTTWLIPKSGPETKNSDCQTWRNDEEKLCYNCKTCKGGVLEESRLTWIIFSILDFFDIAILIIMFTLSCLTRSQIKTDSKYYRVQPPSP
ncbi:Tetraspanin family protein [Euphorbia peplus]|nr:Tetraspanin family protein [Euphorbia peplus]